jgi:DNA-binding PadR family transcriptional regulator
MKKSLTTTSYAVLGLLNIRPWTTYELAKQTQRSLGWFWSRAERKLYDEPKHLVAAGFAEATEEMVGRRPRTVYEITPDGRKALRGWLGESSEPPTMEFEAMVRVFFADAGSMSQLRATLEEVEAQAEERIAEIRSMIEASRADDYEFARRMPINSLALRFQLDHLMQVARWASWARDQTATWRSTTNAGDWDPAVALDG